MLVCGAEVHRVEESVRRNCKAFGAIRTDVFIITSSMVVTVYDENQQSYTQTRRIMNSNINFEKLHLLNKLSRRICEENLSVDEILKELNYIQNLKPYPYWLECLSYAVIAAAFTLFFGGNLMEMLISFFIGFLTRIGIAFTKKIINNKIFSKFFSAIMVTVFSIIAVKLKFIFSVDNIIIGNIMTLIPGIGLTNALRDLFTGDSIAGLLRSIEAFLTAMAITAGYFLIATLQIIAGFIGSLGFAVMRKI